MGGLDPKVHRYRKSLLSKSKQSINKQQISLGTNKRLLISIILYGSESFLTSENMAATLIRI